MWGLGGVGWPTAVGPSAGTVVPRGRPRGSLGRRPLKRSEKSAGDRLANRRPPSARQMLSMHAEHPAGGCSSWTGMYVGVPKGALRRTAQTPVQKNPRRKLVASIFARPLNAPHPPAAAAPGPSRGRA